MNKPIALITGATSGIGEATARVLADHYSLIICGRRQDRLDLLTSELSGLTQVINLSFDVSNRPAVDKAFDGLSPEWSNIDLLVNNAGNAHGLDFIQDGSLDDWDAMMDINVKGLLYVSKRVMPAMIEKQRGHIVNIGSIAGMEVYPKGNVYCASKFAVDAISQGMRLDLNQFGIRVTEIKPGLVETEFSEVRFKGDEDRASTVYEGYEPLTAQDIADTIKYAVLAPDHVTIAEMVVLPTAQASATTVKKS